MKRRFRVGRLLGYSLLLVGMLACMQAVQVVVAPDRRVGVLYHGFQTNAIRFSPDGRWLLSTGVEMLPTRQLEGSTRVWRTDTWKAAHRIPDAEPVGSFTADGRRLLTLDEEGRVGIREVDPGRGWIGRPAALPLQGCKDAALSPDGTLLAAVSLARPQLAIYRVEPLRRIAAIPQAAELLGFSSDGRLLAYTTRSSEKGSEYVFVEARSGKILHRAPGHLAVFSPGGELAVGTDGGSTLTFWDTRTWKVSRTIYTRLSLITSLAFSADAQLLAVGHDDGAMVMDLESGRVVMRMQRPFSRRQVAFAPHAPLLALLSGDTIEIWKVPPRAELMFRARFREHRP